MGQGRRTLGPQQNRYLSPHLGPTEILELTSCLLYGLGPEVEVCGLEVKGSKFCLGL